MVKTMKAAVVEQFGGPLKIKAVPVPKPGPEQVLIKVHACGVCHTDVHAIDGDWEGARPDLPFIPGHETVGEIVEVGSAVTNHSVGDRVGTPWLHSSCGSCEQCLTGWETLCQNQVRGGYDIDGGFAEYAIGHSKFVTALPQGMEYVDIAPLLCAGVTVYKGLSVLNLPAGSWVAISGVGGLGHLAVQYAKAMGFKTVAVDVDDVKLELAARLGATMTVNARDTNPAGFLQRRLGGVHGVLVTAVNRIAFQQAIAMLRPGGVVALNGLPPGQFGLDIFDFVMKGLTMKGSVVGTRGDQMKALELAQQMGIRPTVQTACLDDINDVITRLTTTPVTGRIVLDFD